MTRTAKPPDAADLWLVGYDDLLRIAGLTKATVRAMVARGELPKPRRMGKRQVWDAGVIRARLVELTGEEQP